MRHAKTIIALCVMVSALTVTEIHSQQTKSIDAGQSVCESENVLRVELPKAIDGKFRVGTEKLSTSDIEVTNVAQSYNEQPDISYCYAGVSYNSNGLTERFIIEYTVKTLDNTQSVQLLRINDL